MGPLSPHVAEHIPLNGSRLLQGQENLWKTTWRLVEDLNVNLAIWELFMNTTLRAAVHLGKDYDMNLRLVKSYLWKTTGQLFSETEKLISGVSTSSLHSRACQYSTTKAYVFSDSVLFWGKMRESFWMLEEASGQQLFQRIESNWWTTCGIRVEDFSKIHYCGNPQQDSTDDERITVWIRELHRQDHLHVNV